MLFSVAWLADFVDLSEFWSGTLRPEDRAGIARLGDRLTALGLAVEGTPTHEVQGAEPLPLLDVEVTTNRPDAMCHFGLARELAVALGQSLRAPRAALRESSERASAHVRVELADPAACPRYATRIIRGVKIGPSPDWLQERLRSIGLRPINNVVDITNYVLWEAGQPLHAFDLAKIAGPAGAPKLIQVRRARTGEALRTLDGEVRKLDPKILVIADAARAIALGGIMGGADTEVTATTVDVLLESAHFDRRTVRVGAKALGMHTDASHRFERGTDPEGCAFAARRAAALIAEIAGGDVLGDPVEAVSPEHLVAAASGILDFHRLNRFVGVAIPSDEVRRILTGLGFRIEAMGDEALRVSVPSWRQYDFEVRQVELRDDGAGAVEEQELFEEVLRHYGFDRVTATLPTLSGRDAGSNSLHALRHRVRDHLRACGLAEVINFAFSSNEAEARYPALSRSDAPLRLVNPIAESHAVLRRSMLPNLVESAEFNWRRGARSVRQFEAGHVFPGGNAAEIDAVGILFGGVLGTPWERQHELDLFDLKGVLESLAADCGTTLEARPVTLPGFSAGSSAELVNVQSGRIVGYFGRLETSDAPFPLFAAELRLETLAMGGGPVQVEVPSRYPGIAADLTLSHPVEIGWQAITAAIVERHIEDLRSVSLKDRYQGKGVPEGAVNTTISFFYMAEDRSLTQEEVNDRHLALAADLRARFGWKT
ncbi:MAG: phenylalanine--tRNA ligase subunit beta [Acidobacteriota bacterium]